MNIPTMAALAAKPALFEPGSATMWTDPYIGVRLLDFHLNPEVDAASRRSETIDATVNWIHEKTGSSPGRLLDLGCGPGLYAERFARLGYRVTGVDFSEVSLSYARGRAAETGLDCSYLRRDYRSLDLGSSFDTATLIYLDFCVLNPVDRARVLAEVRDSLAPGGYFVFDTVNGKNIQRKVQTRSWALSGGDGFWRKEPYLVLDGGFLYEDDKVFLEQHLVIGEDGAPEVYRFWNTYYDEGDLEPILDGAGFELVGVHSGVLPGAGPWAGDNVDFYVTRRRP